MEAKPSCSSIAADEVEEAHFSDDDDNNLPVARSAEDSAVASGFDFSGTASAYAGQPICTLCGEKLQPKWDARRQELVIEDAYIIRFLVFHTECVRGKRLIDLQEELPSK